MLKDTQIKQLDPTLEAILCAIAGGVDPTPPKNIDTGMYIITHFNGGECLDVYDNYPLQLDEDYEFNVYGVCDSPEQFRNHPIYDFIHNDMRNFCVTFTEIRKEDQPESGGWRWHKWGPYIGNLDPQHEYIYDEDDTIKSVFVYHIYEV